MTGTGVSGQDTASGSSRWPTLILAICACSAIAVVVLFQINWHIYWIPAGSMEPTVRVGDYLVASQGWYGADDISRGEVILFNQADTVFVKRVIATGGDRVQVIAGIVHLNGAVLKTKRLEDYDLVDPSGVSERVRQLQETLDGRTYRTLDLRLNAHGDNTRLFEVPDGHVFVLGDNRDNSNDSRFQAGIVPVEKIVGIAHSILWSPRREPSIGPITVR